MDGQKIFYDPNRRDPNQVLVLEMWRDEYPEMWEKMLKEHEERTKADPSTKSVDEIFAEA